MYLNIVFYLVFKTTKLNDPPPPSKGITIPQVLCFYLYTDKDLL